MRESVPEEGALVTDVLVVMKGVMGNKERKR